MTNFAVDILCLSNRQAKMSLSAYGCPPDLSGQLLGRAKTSATSGAAHGSPGRRGKRARYPTARYLPPVTPPLVAPLPTNYRPCFNPSGVVFWAACFARAVTRAAPHRRSLLHLELAGAGERSLQRRDCRPLLVSVVC